MLIVNLKALLGGWMDDGYFNFHNIKHNSNKINAVQWKATRW